jgi:hypothetical protein
LAGHAPILIHRGGHRPWGSYQQSTGNRCAAGRFRRSRSTVGVEVTKGYGSSWIFEPYLTCANALRQVQHPAFSLVCALVLHLNLTTVRHAIPQSAHWDHEYTRNLPASIRQARPFRRPSALPTTLTHTASAPYSHYLRSARPASAVRRAQGRWGSCVDRHCWNAGDGFVLCGRGWLCCSPAHDGKRWMVRVAGRGASRKGTVVGA